MNLARIVESTSTGKMVSATMFYPLLFALLMPLLSPFLPGTDTSWGAAKKPLRIGDPPPAVSMRNLNGESIRLPGQYRGKAVIIHFWAVGCSSCKKEMTELESLHRAYEARGLIVVAVNVGQEKELVEKTVRRMGISYGVLLDSDGEMARKYDVAGIPRTYLIDRNGIIRYKIVGESNEMFLKKRIQSIL